MEMNNGRPPIQIDIGVVREYRRAGLKWNDISTILDVSKSTSLMWRQRNNVEVNYYYCYPYHICYIIIKYIIELLFCHLD
jgi:hypothetical protein